MTPKPPPSTKSLTDVRGLDELVDRDRQHDCEGFGPHEVCVKVDAVADLPTRFGRFRIVAFWNNRDGKEHIALVHGDVLGAEQVLTRLHSECLTGDALGSLRCDCRDQLGVALQRIAQEPCGVLLYLRQEGRGIGLLNKIRAYHLQDGGHDTVEANHRLGFNDDERDFRIGAGILRRMGFGAVRLMTNNPRKLEALGRHGVAVVERVPHSFPANDHNQRYLWTKANRSGHMF